MWKSLLLCHDRKDGSPSTKIPTKTKQILHTPLYPIFWTHEIKIYEKNCPFKNTNPLIIELMWFCLGCDMHSFWTFSTCVFLKLVRSEYKK